MANDLPEVTVPDHAPPRYLSRFDVPGEQAAVMVFDSEAQMHLHASFVCEAAPGKFVDLYMYVGSKRLSEDQS